MPANADYLATIEISILHRLRWHYSRTPIRQAKQQMGCEWSFMRLKRCANWTARRAVLDGKGFTGLVNRPGLARSGTAKNSRTICRKACRRLERCVCYSVETTVAISGGIKVGLNVETKNSDRSLYLLVPFKSSLSSRPGYVAVTILSADLPSPA